MLVDDGNDLSSARDQKAKSPSAERARERWVSLKRAHLLEHKSENESRAGGEEEVVQHEQGLELCRVVKESQETGKTGSANRADETEVNV